MLVISTFLAAKIPIKAPINIAIPTIGTIKLCPILNVVKIATAIPIIPSVFPNLDVLGEESPLREKINNTAENKYNNEAMI
jgi:hypothetical protein